MTYSIRTHEGQWAVFVSDWMGGRVPAFTGDVFECLAYAKLQRL